MSQPYRRPTAAHRRRHRRRGGSPFPLLLLLAAGVLVFVFVSRLRTPAAALPYASPSAPAAPVSPSDSPSPQPSASAPLPSLEEAPWQLILVNAAHALPEDWTVETRTLSNGLLVDERIYDALDRMLDDCADAGYSAIVCSAYRTIERQTALFEKKIKSFMSDGLSYSEAYTAASAIVAIPGTSEHNLGLAVDICAAEYQLLNDAQADTPAQQWLMEHCAEYGFILRYPKGKQALTGIIWEPWHYRYVGEELAREITDSGLCLEEYLALSYSDV